MSPPQLNDVWMRGEYDNATIDNGVFHQARRLPSEYSTCISWETLSSFAQQYYQWLESDDITFQDSITDNGRARLVAALFVPRAGGGM